MSDTNEVPYTKHSRRKSLQAIAIIGGMFLFVIVVFGMLFGAGHFLEGS